MNTVTNTVKPLLFIASLLTMFAFSPIYAEVPTKQLSLKGISKLNFKGDAQVTLIQSSDNTAIIRVIKGELEDVEFETDGDSVWISNHGLGFWSWFKNDNGSEVEVEINIAQISHIAASGNIRLNSASIETEHLTLDVSGSSQITIGAVAAETLGLDASGAVTVTFATIDAQTMSVDVSGASHVSVSNAGVVHTQSVDVSGASHYSAGSLISEQASVDVSGASFVKVHASQELSADVSGASSLEYTGDPRMSVNTSGASTIKKL